MIQLKKSAIGMIVLAFTSLILITGSPFQILTYLGENNGHLYIKNIGQEAYGADDDDGDEYNEEKEDVVKETCEDSDGKWHEEFYECEFKPKEGDDEWNDKEGDQTAFEHNLEDDGLYNHYQTMRYQTQVDEDNADWEYQYEDVN